MSYDLSILSDAYSTFSVPTSQALTTLQSITPMNESSRGRFECPISDTGGLALHLTLDEVNEEGDSLAVLAAEESGEPWDFDSIPDRVNLISASLPFDL